MLSLSYAVLSGLLKSSLFRGSFGGIPQKQEIRIPQKEDKAMPKRVLPLTDLQIQKAKPAEKDYKLSDGGGLYTKETTKTMKDSGTQMIIAI